MAKLNPTYKSSKSLFSLSCDNELRSFSATVKAIKERAERCPAEWNEIANAYLISLDNFNMDYIRENLPLKFNSEGKFCTLKKAEKGLQHEGFEVREYTDFDHVLIPKYRFTTNEVITLIEACERAKAKKATEAKKAKKAEKAESKKADQIAILKAKLAKLENK